MTPIAVDIETVGGVKTKIIPVHSLQQNGFTYYDMLCPVAETVGLMTVIVDFHDAAQKTIAEPPESTRLAGTRSTTR